MSQANQRKIEGLHYKHEYLAIYIMYVHTYVRMLFMVISNLMTSCHTYTYILLVQCASIVFMQSCLSLKEQCTSYYYQAKPFNFII